MFQYCGWDVVNSPENADLIQFTGGADIEANLYFRPRHRTMYYSEGRTAKELSAFTIGKTKKIPMAGICRGAQLLNVLLGGSMWQHVDGHGNSHTCLNLRDNSLVRVTSCHHQCMIPAPGAEVILVSNKSSVHHRMLSDGTEEILKNKDVPSQVEAWIKGNILGWQGHPEWEDNPVLYFKLLSEILK